MRLGEAADVLGVSVDTVRRWADAGRLGATRTGGGQREVDDADVARLAAARAEVRTAPVIVAQSARNRFPGIVTDVVKDRVMAKVEIQAGPFRVVSLMSREACDELGLEPGVAAIASIKSTNVVVELAE
jgi:molybdopterin-binding protein